MDGYIYKVVCISLMSVNLKLSTSNSEDKSLELFANCWHTSSLLQIKYYLVRENSSLVTPIKDLLSFYKHVTPSYVMLTF